MSCWSLWVGWVGGWVVYLCGLVNPLGEEGGTGEDVHLGVARVADQRWGLYVGEGGWVGDREVGGRGGSNEVLDSIVEWVDE